MKIFLSDILSAAFIRKLSFKLFAAEIIDFLLEIRWFYSNNRRNNLFNVS